MREEDYPERWQQGEGLTFPISYHFEPGAADDGLTIDVPVATLNRVAADDFSWNVPGVRQELVTSLIRSLPKNLRVSFVPAPDRAREFLASTPPGEEPLLDALERWARSTTGVVVPRDAWDWTKVPAHLQPTYRVARRRGRRAGPRQGPRRAQGAAGGAVRRGPRGGRRRQRVRRDRPDRVDVRRAADRDPAAPGRPRGAGLPGGPRRGRRPSGSACSARRRRRRRATGTAYDGCCCWRCPSPADPTEPARHHPAARPRGLAVRLGRRAPRRRPRRDPHRRRRRAPARPHPRVVRRAGGGRRATPLAERTDQVVLDVLRVLADWRETDRALSGRAELATLPALQDMREQLARLVGRGFLGEAGADRLRRFPTYLLAIRRRREQLDEQVARDRQLMDQVRPLDEAYLHQVAALQEGRPPGDTLRRARWMLEEYRVSLFAQQLGTDGPVSDQRIRKLLATLSSVATVDAVTQRPHHRPLTPGDRFFEGIEADDPTPCASPRRPTVRRACWCAVPATPVTARSPSGCSTSPTPRGSRRSRRSGPVARPTRSPAACGGSTSSAPGCTPTRWAWRGSSRPDVIAAAVARGRGRGRRPAGPRRAAGDGRPGAARHRRQRLRRRPAARRGVRPGGRHRSRRAPRRRHRRGRPDPGRRRPARPRRPAGAGRRSLPSVRRLDGCGHWPATQLGDTGRRRGRSRYNVRECAGPRQPRVPTSAASSGHAP